MSELSSSNSGSCDDTNLSSVDNNATLPSQSSAHLTKVCVPQSLSQVLISNLTVTAQFSTSQSQSLINSWTWSDQPSPAQLTSCLERLVTEQSQLVSGAAASSLSSARLSQRLTVLQRYLTAVGRSGSSLKSQDGQEAAKMERTRPGCQTSRAQPAPSEKAALGLARVGSRAALSFAFAFLRRAWRSGEDQDLCSDLLTESLEALQALPEASLFHTETVSKVCWKF